jgi:hypothetical protein
MSEYNPVNDIWNGIDHYFNEACKAATEGRDHGEALRHLDAELHKLRKAEEYARKLAMHFDCALKDVWYAARFTAYEVTCTEDGVFFPPPPPPPPPKLRVVQAD